MKKLLFVCLFVVGAMVQVQAQDNSEFKNETVEFLKLTGSGAAFEKAIDQIGAGISADKKEQYLAEAKGTLVGLYDKMAELYMAEFTQEEIRELVAFYKTDLGKKLSGKQVTLMEKAMTFGQSWGVELYNIAQKYM